MYHFVNNYNWLQMLIFIWLNNYLFHSFLDLNEENVQFLNGYGFLVALDKRLQVQAFHKHGHPATLLSL